MAEWLYAVQRLIDWIDAHVCENPSLAEISMQIGYSPYYCSEQFHKIAGMTIREYMAKRRLTMAAIALRDTDLPIAEVALQCGFSDQAVLTRAFQSAYGCAPSAYRKNPVPLPLVFRKNLSLPSEKIKGEDDAMSNLVLPSVRVEYIPAHKYLGVYEKCETKNGPLWPRHDCDLLCGIVSSIKESDLIVTAHTAGWTWKDSQRSYFYGSGVPSDYQGAVPEGFELRGEFPGSYYLVFCHPPFEYASENAEVMKRVEELAWSCDPQQYGFVWNEDVCQDYQRHYPEGLGYQVLRPVRKQK